MNEDEIRTIARDALKLLHSIIIDETERRPLRLAAAHVALEYAQPKPPVHSEIGVGTIMPFGSNHD